jgi:cytochrome c biogenesis protein ResB
MTQFMELVAAKPKTTNEENLGGITFRISNTPDDQDGIYLVLEDIPKLPEIKIGNTTYKIHLRKVQRPLPFSIELLDFKRDMHAGTDKAKAYESRVRINDNGLQWESVISMNAPLRYKGYTFFQSSFIATPKGDVSVLAVVWNVGRTFPYIASLAMCLGLLLHLFLRKKKS